MKTKLTLLAASLLLILGACSNPPAEKTVVNLKTSADDCATSAAAYSAFAVKASEEGFPGVANLFKAVAMSEKIDADNYVATLKSMGHEFTPTVDSFEVNSTVLNLEQSIARGTYAYMEMYPDYIGVATGEKAPEMAVKYFSWASDSKKNQGVFFEQALAEVKAINDAQALVSAEKNSELKGAGATLSQIAQADSLLAVAKSQPLSVWYVCPTCGDVYVEGSYGETCNICGTESSKFVKF